MNSTIIEVNQSNFQGEVLERSFREPVLVDFWAPWCGPCRMLGPILERIANEPDSGFVLAKLNSDHSPNLSAQYDVRGIPAVKAFVNGRIVDEFVGVQPEPVVRKFTQHIKADFKPNSANRPKQSGQKATDPQTRLADAQRYLKQGDGCKAQTLLANYPSGPREGEARELYSLAQFICSSGRNVGGTMEVQNYYSQAVSAMQHREPSAALYNLLVALNQEPQNRKATPKNLILAIFTLIGDDHSLTKQYRPLIS